MRNIHFANVSTSEYYPESTPGTVSMAFALATRVNSSHPVHHPGPEYYPGPCFTIPQVIRHRRPNSLTPRSIIPTESATPIELFTSKGILRPSPSIIPFLLALRPTQACAARSRPSTEYHRHRGHPREFTCCLTTLCPLSLPCAVLSLLLLPFHFRRTAPDLRLGGVCRR